MALLIIAALGLIAALAWDDALKMVFDSFLGMKGGLIEEISYAAFMTIIATLVSVWLGKSLKKRRSK